MDSSRDGGGCKEVFYWRISLCRWSVKKIDKWTEVLGPSVVMDWVRLFGIPLHIWRKETLEKLGEMVGVVEEVDDRCLQLEVVEFARMKIIHPVDAEIAKTCG